MKTVKIAMLVLLAGLFSMPWSYADAPKSRDVIIGVTDAYIPSNFDSSSDAFAVVTGLFPNSCYRFKETKVEHVGATLHEVTTYANVTEGLCLMVLVPFNKEVALGKLQVGEHQIHFLNGDGTYLEKRLTIEN